MQIPTLLLQSSVPATFSVNGAHIGEGESQTLALPVAPSSVYYVGVSPLIPNYCPITRKIELEEGILKEDLVVDTSAIIWREGLIQLFFQPFEIKQPTALEPAQNIQTSMLRYGMMATLFREGGIHLAIERGDDVLFSQTVALAGTAAMEIIELEDAILVFVQVEIPKSNPAELSFQSTTPKSRNSNIIECCCVRIDDQVTLTYSAKAQKIRRKNATIELISPLGTLRNHEKKDTVDLSTGRLLNSETGFFSEKPLAVQNEQQAAIALLDAVRLGLEDEITNLLGGDLLGLDLESLRDFFGEYSRAIIAPSQLSERIIIGLLNYSQISTAHLFGFEAENIDSGWKIINAYEI